jgi:hypothetical protein
MSNTESSDSERGGSTRDRSPSFPSFSLAVAVERTRQLFEKAKRHEVRLPDAAADWGISPTSSLGARIAATLLSFGLIESLNSGGERRIKVSEEGWRILEDHRPGVKDQLLSEAALKPKLIAEYADKWKDGRPDDSHAISQLKFDSHFSAEAAATFLRVFDETIRFTKSTSQDKDVDSGAVGSPKVGEPLIDTALGGYKPNLINPVLATPAPAKQKGVLLMEGERELTTGLLSKEASFRLIVTGKIGEKEIDRLIKKLQLDKEILSDPDSETKPDGKEAAN